MKIKRKKLLAVAALLSLLSSPAISNGGTGRNINHYQVGFSDGWRHQEQSCDQVKKLVMNALKEDNRALKREYLTLTGKRYYSQYELIDRK